MNKFVEFVRKKVLAAKTTTLDKLPKDKELYVFFPETMVPDAIGKNGLVTCRGGWNIAKKVIITSITKGYYEGTFSIQYRCKENSWMPVHYYVPTNFKVCYLSRAETKQMIKEYKEFKTKNLKQFLGHAFKVGADPEIFVEDEKGIVYPAFNFLGSKEKANKTKAVNYGNQKVYWDGFQAEFEIIAETCLGWVSDGIQLGLEAVSRFAKEKNKTLKLSAKTVMEIPQEQLDNSAPEHVSLGCMPSFNIYNMEGRKVKDPRQLRIRSAGGHIHFGIGKKDDKTIERMVKALDAILGVACVSMFAKYDNPMRREYYGLAGEYRLPAHGLEYRTLSNAWLFHPFIANLVLDLSRKALVFGEQGFMELWNAKESETIKVINECDVDGARKILERNKGIFIQLLKAAYGQFNEAQLEKLYQIFLNGMETAIENPENIEDNWGIKSNYWIIHCNGAGKQTNTAMLSFLLQNKKVA